MKKTIHIVYPYYTAVEFEQAIPLVNHDIYADNVSHPVRRLVLQIMSLLVLLLLLFFGILIFYHIFQPGPAWNDLTGKRFVLRLFLILFAAFFYLLFVLFFWIDLRRRLYRQFHVRSRTEAYSIQKYSEKHDSRKNLHAQYAFYKSCDRLRQAEILDVSFSPSGMATCTVKVSFRPAKRLDPEEIVFTDIRLARQTQAPNNIDYWLDLEQRKLAIYTPDALRR